MKRAPSARRRVYLVAPRNPDSFWCMATSVKAVGARALMPNSALATLIALTPEDAGIDFAFCDENLSPIDLGMPCDLVAVTGFTLHAPRIREISAHFRSRGIPVALGGAFATLTPDEARPLADHLFMGEAELAWPRFLADWAAGAPAPLYEQKEHLDMSLSPPPDWRFIRGKDYLYFTVQASRGCPNRCDFCNAVQLVGRRYRHKSVEQVLQEVENARRMGAETVFFSEDNFFVNRAFTRELLQALIDWNTRQARPLSFSCQASVTVGADEEIVKLMADARFSVVFLGVESLSADCLTEVNKGHLARYDARTTVTTLSRYGIIPFIGFIVGFDHDTPATFDELERFLEETGSPIASISVLNAPEGTPLFLRLKEQGRIAEEFAGIWHFSTNIVPTAMPLKVLLENHRALFRSLYEPESFERRTLAWLDGVKYRSPLYGNARTNWPKMLKAVHIFRFFMAHPEKSVRKMFLRILRTTWKTNPRGLKKAITILSQFPHYYAFSHDAKWYEAGK